MHKLLIELAMMGVKNFVLVDKGQIKKTSKERHYYFSSSDIGKNKVDSLKKNFLNLKICIILLHRTTIHFGEIINPSYGINFKSLQS